MGGAHPILHILYVCVLFLVLCCEKHMLGIFLAACEMWQASVQACKGWLALAGRGWKINNFYRRLEAEEEVWSELFSRVFPVFVVSFQGASGRYRDETSWNAVMTRDDEKVVWAGDACCGPPEVAH
ncbi:hypothetical protein BDY19DRAFT_903414 [Irpex rosettiformis]|uniref:Uncharacterized protein n=1 Tax=Irpex rosettiformis TaxID=378272 RepID=A0ACB8UEE7_9APHY|nr:hypothetical protein BDY19DRAFT_903414 [Irpex rosettiformis]